MSNIRERAKECPELLRTKRKRLFKAFDIFKGNTYLGIDNVSEERKTEIIAWYHKALDLDANAIDNYPQELEKYLW